MNSGTKSQILRHQNEKMRTSTSRHSTLVRQQRGPMKRLISYLWPFASYRDADHGSMLERAAASRHNQQLSKSLPTYINRWAISASVELILTEVMPAVLVPVFAILFTVSFCALTLFVAIWMMFKRSYY
jgi:hypothetical protein